MSIRITFDIPNIAEAEFVLAAVREKVDQYRARQATQAAQAAASEPNVEPVVTPVVAANPPVQEAPPPAPAAEPRKGPGRPKKSADPVAEAPAPAPAPVAAPVAAPAPAANIFDAPPATVATAAPDVIGDPKEALNALYNKISDTKGAGAAISATMKILKAHGVSRVQDLPKEKYGAFLADVAQAGA